MDKFIDIHTHQIPNDNSILAVKNYILGIDEIDNQNFFSAGIHPWYIDEAQSTRPLLKKIINRKNCVAIGECGLDLMQKILNKYDLKQQQDVFIMQAGLAEIYRKPLIIHCVKCFDKLMLIKKTFKPESAWIIHGFNKNKDLAQQLVKAGFYLSFGISLFKNKKNREALKIMPLNRIFFETDDQIGYDIKKIYKEAAAIKDMTLADLQKQINKNFETVFLKPKP